MKAFARQRSFTRGGSLWVSGAVAVVLGVALFVINSRQHSEDEEHSPDLNNPGEPTAREREGNTPDDEPSCEHSAQQGQTDETDDGVDQAREDDDYVVLSEDEIGPAILRASSTDEFSVSSAEVRRTWSLIKGDITKVITEISSCNREEVRLSQNISMRVHSILRTKDSEAAAAIDELISLADNGEGGGGGFGAMIREIVEQSANPACLEAKLRSVGEEHLTVEVKASHIQSLSEALVRAVGEALRGRESLLPHTVAAWDDFLATAWACMMLAGAGECIRRKKRQDSSPRACIPAEVGRERSAVRGWRREGGLLKYSIPRTVRSNPTGVEKQRIARESAAASIAGVVGVDGKQ